MQRFRDPAVLGSRAQIARCRKGKSFMASAPQSAEEYRATALLCRQQAACDPDKSWRLLGEAERWEYLAEAQSASDLKDCNFPQSERRDTRLARPVSG
jgi:hypothetical protein